MNVSIDINIYTENVALTKVVMIERAVRPREMLVEL